MSAAERSAAYEWGFEKGEQAERERIIKLLEQENKFLERGQFNRTFLIALIRGENK